MLQLTRPSSPLPMALVIRMNPFHAHVVLNIIDYRLPFISVVIGE